MNRRLVALLPAFAFATLLLAGCDSSTASPAPSGPIVGPIASAVPEDCPTGVHDLAAPGDKGRACFYISGQITHTDGKVITDAYHLTARWVGGNAPAVTLVDAKEGSDGVFTIAVPPSSRWQLEITDRDPSTVRLGDRLSTGDGEATSAVVETRSDARYWLELEAPSDTSQPISLTTETLYPLALQTIVLPTPIPNALEETAAYGASRRFDPAAIDALRAHAAELTGDTPISLFAQIYLLISVLGVLAFGLFDLWLGVGVRDMTTVRDAPDGKKANLLARLLHR